MKKRSYIDDYNDKLTDIKNKMFAILQISVICLEVNLFNKSIFKTL